MLNELSVSSLIPEELVTLSDRLVTATTPPYDAVLAKRTEKVKMFSGFLTDAINRKKTSEFTAVLAQTDHERDNAFRSFNFAVLSAVYNNVTEISKAGNILREVIKRHNPSLYRLGYVAQTTEMKSLKQELDKLSEVLTNAGVKSQYDQMTASMAAFNQVFKEKTEAESGPKKPGLGESRKKLSEKIILLLRQIQIFIEDEEDGIESLVDKYNEVISSTMALAKARKTRGNNNSNDGDGASQDTDSQDSEDQE
ncbi:MAG: DUF6261 family protein [Cyclobacteriaceae bacterium]